MPSNSRRWSAAGQSAVDYIKGEAKDGKLSLDHVRDYHKEIEANGIETDRVAPALIPDYTEPEVRERQLTANYVGNVR